MDGRGGVSRRQFLGSGALAAATLAFGPGFWRDALGAPATTGPGRYGPLQPPDANGLMLPAGFSSREIARGGQAVVGTDGIPYSWHAFSDGQAMYSAAEGGWILVSNSESVAPAGAGSSAIRFNPDGSIRRAYRILAGTNANCAGGATPWGTWLSCEEWDGGQVWECDPTGGTVALVRPAMGAFNHEAACVDPIERRVYLTEDEGDGGLYRFTPSNYPELMSGLLEVAKVAADGTVTWAAVPDPSGISAPTRHQVPGMAQFKRGEGIWFDSGIVYVATTSDSKIHAYHTATQTIDLIYDHAAAPDSPLKAVDNITVSPSGDLFVCEDGDDLDICVVTPEREVARFLKLTGAPHDGSEMTGVIFDPSATRLYFSSQRGYQLGVIYEVTGPFRTGGGTALAPLAGPVPGAAGSRRFAAMARRRIRLSTLLRRGLAVRVRVDRPGTVVLALRTGDLERARDDRRSVERPRQITLARTTRRFRRAGVYRVRMRLGKRAAARLLRARRSPLARISAQMRTGSGGIEVATRRIRILRRG